MPKSTKPLVRNEILIAHNAGRKGGGPIRVGSPAWFAWLSGNEGFIYEGSVGHLTARRELRRGICYWYGYRRLHGKLTKIYLGKPKDLLWERLEQASAQLAGELPLQQIVGGIGEMSPAVAPGSAVDLPSPNALEETSYLPLTKIKPPALPMRLLARPRLTGAMSAPVTIICAPSGFGKTTLLNEWRQGAGRPVAWVSLDAEDNHPVRFWSTVILGVQKVVPGLGENWFSQLGSAAPSSLSKVVVNLTNDLVRVTEMRPGPDQIGLVLDNYHHIQNSEIHTSIQNLLDHMPSALQVIFSSHSRPPFALGYLRAKGLVVELGPEDLRLTLEEGIEFLRLHTARQHVAYSDMQGLVKHTEGWITGLVLAAAALDQQEGRPGSVESRSGGRALGRDFLTENVLSRQPADVQAFLVRTSILKRLTGSLCDSVTGQAGSAALLDRLCEEGLFLEREEEADWYRYHTLFAETLLARLQEELPADVRRLHRRAAKWYRARNDPANAIFHLLAGKEWEEAAGLIEGVALSELEQRGEDSRLLGWLRQLPEAVLGQHKVLLGVYLRLVRIVLPPAEVGDILARIERGVSGTPEVEKPATAHEALADLQRLRGNWAAADEQVLEIPAGDGHETAWQLLDGIAWFRRDFRCDLVRAEGKARAVYEAALERRHLYGILVAGGGCANLALSQGHLQRSEQIAQQVLRQAFELRGELPGSASIVLASLGNVYFMRNRIAQAHQLLVRATEVDPDPASTNELVTIAILRAKIQSAQGDNEAAFATIQAIRELHAQRPSNLWLDQDLIAYQELFRLRQGDLAAAERLLSEGVDVETNAFSALVRAEILIEQQRSVAAEDILVRLLAAYPHGSYLLPMLRARVILAIALFEQRKVNQARQAMAEAAHLAAPEYFIRPFLDYGPKIAPLFSLILRSETLGAGTRSFLRGVLTMLGHANGVTRGRPREAATELDVAASISPREQEVLRMLSAGLSNREIAERYSISISTVKTHIESIFRKLGVSSRTQAIAEGQKLDLI